MWAAADAAVLQHHGLLPAAEGLSRKSSVAPPQRHVSIASLPPHLAEASAAAAAGGASPVVPPSPDGASAAVEADDEAVAVQKPLQLLTAVLRDVAGRLLVHVSSSTPPHSRCLFILASLSDTSVLFQVTSTILSCCCRLSARVSTGYQRVSEPQLSFASHQAVQVPPAG